VLEKKIVPKKVAPVAPIAPVMEGEIRRSSRIKEVLEIQQLHESLVEAPVPSSSSTTSSSFVLSNTAHSVYRHMDEPWRLVTLQSSGHVDEVSFCKQELVTLGNKLVKYCPELVQLHASDWRRDVKAALTLRELIPSTIMLEDVLYQAEHPVDNLEFEVTAGMANSQSDDEEEEEEEEENAGRGGRGGSRGASSNNGQVCRGMSTDDAFICKESLAWLRSRAQAVWFAEPVDPIALGIPQYFDIVKKPMDFGTIAVKLARGDYSGHEQFKEDMELVFENAVTFTPEEDAEVHKV
jgi:hypothetical protein